MKTIEITSNSKEYTYKIPESWDEVNVGNFMDIVGVEDNDLLSDFQKSIEVMNIVSGISKDLIEDMDFETEFTPLVEVLDFLKEPVPEKTVEFIKVKGDKYYLKKDFDKKTAGEVASFDLIFKKNKNNLYSCIDQLLPLFLRKKDKEGKLERFNSDMMDRISMFRDHVKISDVLAIFFYFSDGSKPSQKVTD